MIPKFVTDPNPDLYRTGSYLVLDFETTTIDFGTALNPKNRLILACWQVVKDGKRTAKFAWGNEYSMSALMEDIAEVDFIVAHNAKFELQWLARCGHDVGSKPVYDTMLAEWVLAGARPWRFNLNAAANRAGVGQKDALIGALIKGGVPTEDIPRSFLLRYCLQDVQVTYDLMQSQLAEMEGTRLLPILYTRCLTTLCLSDIERHGICLDTARVTEEYDKALAEFNDVERELHEMTGGINARSPQQVAEYLYDVLGFPEPVDYKGNPRRTPSGKRVANKDTIAQLTPTTEDQRKFLDLKQRQGKLSAMLSKNLDFFMGICNERDGIFLGQLNQGRTVTHRLASSGMPVVFEGEKKARSCQFQNLPRKFKRLFTPRKEGWYIAEADGAQLEFRVAGHLGDDDVVKHDIINHVDIHRFTADRLLEAGDPEIVNLNHKQQRQESKKHTFRPLYGGTKGSPAVEAYCVAFTKKYSSLHQTQRRWVLQALDQGFIETEWGMRYYFPNLRMQARGHVTGQQAVFNYPIQAFATAEIIPIALVYLWYRTRKTDILIVNSVHDSMICEIPPDKIELFALSAVKALTLDVYDYLKKVYDVSFTVPLGVGMKLGKHWGENGLTDGQLAALVELLEPYGANVEVDDGELTLDVYPKGTSI